MVGTISIDLTTLIITPIAREMKLTDSKFGIYGQEGIYYLVEDMLRDDEHLCVGAGTGGHIFFGTLRRLRNVINNPINNLISINSPINNPAINPTASANRKQGRLYEAKAYLRVRGAGGALGRGDEKIAAAVRTAADEWTTKDAAEYYSYGITGCANIRGENLRFLTQRGSMIYDGTYGEGRQI